MSNARIEGLIGKLANFRTRSAASDALVAGGAEAVGPLVEALRRPELEGARWSVINCLGEIGDPAAVSAIAPFLEETDYQSVTHDALVKIAGRDVGPLVADWMRWLEDGGAEAAGAGPQQAGGRGNDELVDLAVREAAGHWREEAEGRFAVDLDLSGGGRQKVCVVFGSTDHEGAEIVIVYSVCGKAAAEHYETALRKNLRLPYGAIALRDIGGEPHFVMFNTILRQGLSPVELRKSIVTVGERSDAVARQLK